MVNTNLKIRSEILKKLLLVSLSNPKYSSFFLRNIESKSFNELLEEFSFIDKKFIQDGFPFSWFKDSKALKNRLEKNELEIAQTSGSTGDRTQLIRGKNWWADEFDKTSKFHNFLREIYKDTVKKCVLTTARCSGTDCHIGTVSKEERTKGDSLFLNAVRDPSFWSEADLERIVREIIETKPDFIAADPYYLMHLVLYMKRKNIQPFEVKCISLGFEFANLNHVRTFKEFFQVPVFDVYGTTEVGILFMECEHGFIHHFPYKSYIETIDSDENLTNDVGELVVTSFKNKYMPLIRYKTGDLVKIIEAKKCKCGFFGKSIKCFEGRKSEVTTYKNKKITPRNLDRTVSNYSDIHFYQLEQKFENYLFRYVTTYELSDDKLLELKNSLMNLYGGNASITLKRVSSIPVGPSGKYIISFKQGAHEQL